MWQDSGTYVFQHALAHAETSDDDEDDNIVDLNINAADPNNTKIGSKKRNQRLQVVVDENHPLFRRENSNNGWSEWLLGTRREYNENAWGRA